MIHPSTILALSGMGVPPYSARGLTQTLEPIQASQNMLRTVNAVLTDISADQFRKYKSTITGADQDPPALEGKWPGMSLVVDCIPELSYITFSDLPDRVVVSGSLREEGDFTFYRPRLTMLIVNFVISKDEYGVQTGWTLELEEV